MSSGAVERDCVDDFGGAGKPDEPYGVRTFKAKYGGELVNYGRYVCVHSRGRLAISRIATADITARGLPIPSWSLQRLPMARRLRTEPGTEQRPFADRRRSDRHADRGRLSHRRDDWNVFVAEDPSFALLQSWEWGEFKERLGWKAFRIAAESHGRMIAAAELLIKPAPGRVASVAYVPRGPVGEWNDDGVARCLFSTRSIASCCLGIALVFLRVEPPRLDNSPAARLLEVLGFRESPATNQPPPRHDDRRPFRRARRRPGPHAPQDGVTTFVSPRGTA